MPILYEKDQHRHVHEKLSVLHSNISRVTRWDTESGLFLLLHKLNVLWRNCDTAVHMARQYISWHSGTHYGTVVHIMAQWYTNVMNIPECIFGHKFPPITHRIFPPITHRIFPPITHRLVPPITHRIVPGQRPCREGTGLG